MDEKDVQMCKMLARDSRLSYREIGDALDLSVNSVHKRIQALLGNGVINRFVLVPSIKMLDAIVVLLFGTSDTKNMKETIKRLGANPNTYRIVLATGNYLYVHGVLRKLSDMEKYISFVKQTGEMGRAELGILSSPEKMDIQLTRLDYRIMKSMSIDSRRDFSEVAGELGVSTRTVKRRFDRMLAAGAIHASIEFNPIASGSVICMVHLKIQAGVGKKEAVAYINNTHGRNLLSVAGMENHPDILFINGWAVNMRELNEMQDAMEASGLFESAVPHIYYNAYNFDSWKESFVSESASGSGD